jgi:hypothetical protein
MLSDVLDLVGFNKLPKPARIGAFVGVGAIGVGAIYFLRAAAGWLIGGVVVVLVLVIAFEIFRRYKAKKEGKTFSESLKAMLKLQPRTASAEERSRLEQMREKFEEGIEKFRSAGRSVYDVPWFILIGEPGSGKTEAIRRSNIAFPPGLQDRFQGAGGTVNMDWWFTNDAVIIDTAGRIIVEEVAAGEVAEWDQLLTMLKGQRKKCPINGVVLMLPAAAPPVEPGQQPATGGLLDDTTDQIEQRATRFVDRLSRLQQRLGVRFPVFIVVTMCDRVLGFREFFDDLTDIEQQHQMLGWSNPASLDEPYKPDMIVGALAEISDRLRKRRLELLRDPVHTEDAHKRRADQVDKLYAFPEAFDTLAPNLRAYLDRLFTKTAWYQPPFFRGVFFTSSMQKGAAIDNALAELVGAADADAVSGGGIFRADRAYFLKDVIEKKVFQEKGLVTDAADAEGTRRKARLIMWVAGGAAAALLLTSMIWGVICSWNWQKANLDPWRNARNAYFYPEDQGGQFIPERAALILPIGDAVPVYNATPGGDDSFGGTSLDIQRRLLTRLETAEGGFMCRLFGSSFGADTSQAQAMLLARVTARPAATFALQQLSGAPGADGSPGEAPATDLDADARALAELLRWSTLALGQRPKAAIDAEATGAVAALGTDPALIDFGRIAEIVRVQTSETDLASWDADNDAFAEVFKQTATRLRGEDEVKYRAWLAFALGLDGVAEGAGADQRRAWLAQSVERVVGRYQSPDADTSAFGSLVTLEDAVNQFLDTERALWAMASEQAGAMTEDDATRLQAAWLRRYEDLQRHRQRIDEVLPRLRTAAGNEGVTPTFVRGVINQRRETAVAAFNRMLGALPPAPGAEGAPPDPQTDAGWLESLRARIALQQAEFGEAFEARAQALGASAQVWAPHVESLDAEGSYAIGRRLDAYRLAQDRLAAGATLDGPVYLTSLATTLEADSGDARDRMRRADEALNPVLSSDRPELRASATEAQRSLQFALDLAASLRRQEAVVQALDAGWPSPEGIASSFADSDRTFPTPTLSRLQPRADGAPIRADYSVGAGQAIAGAYAMVQSGVAQTGGSALLNPDEAQRALAGIKPQMQSWLGEYAAYWDTVLADATDIRDYDTWASFREQALPDIRPFDAKRQLEQVRGAIDQAVEPLSVLPENERGAAVSRLLSRIEAGRQAESAILADYPLDSQLNLVTNYLRGLPASPTAARDRVLADMRAGRVEPFDFLKKARQNLGGREYVFETRYSIQLLVAALEAIRTDTYGGLVGQYNQFVQNNQGRFPFAPPPNGLPLAQFTGLPAVEPGSLGDFGGVESLVGGGDPAEDAAAFAGYPSALRDAASSLADLLGPQERERADRLFALKQALTGPQGTGVDLGCSVVLLGQRNLDRPTNVNYLRVSESGQRNRPQAFTGVEDASYTDARINAPYRFNAARSLTLELLNTENDTSPVQRVELGEWSALKMLYAFDARPAEAPAGAPSAMWDVRVPVGSGEVWLRLVFNRPTPPLDQWPRF